MKLIKIHSMINESFIIEYKVNVNNLLKTYHNFAKIQMPIKFKNHYVRYLSVLFIVTNNLPDI